LIELAEEEGDELDQDGEGEDRSVGKE